MGRELRRVIASWEHPKKDNGKYYPLLGRSFKEELSEWKKEKKQWDSGLVSDFNGGWEKKDKEDLKMSFEEYNGEKPIESDYMPEWKEEEKTHIQLYENTSEGTPLSPVFHKDDFELLCQYAEKNATTFADFKVTKEEWMQMLKQDLVIVNVGGLSFI